VIGITTFLSVIMLNVNGLDSQSKDTDLWVGLKKTRPNNMLPTRNTSLAKTNTSLKLKNGKRYYK
jgi:hypothetical protein